MTSVASRLLAETMSDIPAAVIGIGEWTRFVQTGLFLAFHVVLAFPAAKFWARSSGGRAHDTRRMRTHLAPPLSIVSSIGEETSGQLHRRRPIQHTDAPVVAAFSFGQVIRHDLRTMVYTEIIGGSCASLCGALWCSKLRRLKLYVNGFRPGGRQTLFLYREPSRPLVNRITEIISGANALIVRTLCQD